MSNTRFIQSVTKATEHSTVEMPWARGARRAIFISRRKATVEMRKSA